jgi:hypothetical protein
MPVTRVLTLMATMPFLCRVLVYLEEFLDLAIVHPIWQQHVSAKLHCAILDEYSVSTGMMLMRLHNLITIIGVHTIHSIRTVTHF